MAFGGAFCEELPDASSLAWYNKEGWSAEYKYATDKWTYLELGVEKGKAFRFLHLKTSAGKQVEIQVVRVTPEDGCDDYESFMEIQLGSFLLGGFKIVCGKRLPQERFISEDSLAVISLVELEGAKQFAIMYRSIPRVEVVVKAQGAMTQSIVLLLLSCLVYWFW
uniref:F5/8 type C domain-containing protein n=1 Tax=Steinernema glaseri TaxID=37863 RepID=A0A1I7YSM4_9BILA